jgi:predicted Na+-dependent transporter
MTPTTKQIIQQHTADLERINKQRRMWLYASSIVLTGIIFLIFTWDWLDDFHSKGIWWVVISLMLIISVNWWYWTMRVIRILLDYNTAAYDILTCVLDDVSEARKDIQYLVNQNVDKPK